MAAIANMLWESRGAICALREKQEKKIKKIELQQWVCTVDFFPPLSNSRRQKQLHLSRHIL